MSGRGVTGNRGQQIYRLDWSGTAALPQQRGLAMKASAFAAGTVVASATLFGGVPAGPLLPALPHHGAAAQQVAMKASVEDAVVDLVTGIKAFLDSIPVAGQTGQDWGDLTPGGLLGALSFDPSLSTLLGYVGLDGNSTFDDILGGLGPLLPDGGATTLGSLFSLVGITDSTTLGTLLSDLHLGDTTLGGLLSSVGVTGNPSLADLLGALNITNTTTLGDLLGVVGLQTSTTLGDLLNMIGLPADTSMGDLLGDIGVDPTASLGATLTDWGMPADLQLLSPFSMGDLLTLMGLNYDTSTFGDVLGLVGLQTTDTIGGLLASVGLPTTTELGDLLGDSGLPLNTPITDLLGDAGLPLDTTHLSDLLSSLGLADGLNTTVPELLQTLGVDTTSGLDDMLGQFGLSSTDTLSGLLGDLGLPTATTVDSLLAGLGLSDTDTIGGLLDGLTGGSTLDGLLDQLIAALTP